MPNPNSNVTKTSTEQQIPAYANINAQADSAFEQDNGAQSEHQVKGVTIIFNVITSTGVGGRKELLEFLLGSDAST